MSAELAVAGIQTGSTVVAKIRRDSDEYVYDVVGDDFEVYNNTDSSNGRYDVILTEQGTSGYFVGNFPTAITTAGTYNISYFTRTGSGPYTYQFEAAGSLDWDGSSAIELASGINWITRAEYKAWAGITDTSQDDQIDATIPMISALGNQYIGRTVKATDHSKVYRGQPGASGLLLYQRPINSVTTVTFDYMANGEYDVDGSDFYSNSDTGALRFRPDSLNGRTFNSEFIHVVFSAGYTTVPQDLKLAACLLVKASLYLADDEQAISEKSVKDVKIKYDQLIMADASNPILGNAVTILNTYKDEHLLVV